MKGLGSIPPQTPFENGRGVMLSCRGVPPTTTTAGIWNVELVSMAHRQGQKVTVFSFLRGVRRHTHIPKITLFHRYPFLTYFGHVLFTKCSPCLGRTTICRERVAKKRRTAKTQNAVLSSPRSGGVEKKGEWTAYGKRCAVHFLSSPPRENEDRIHN